MSVENKGLLRSTLQITFLSFLSILLSFVTQLVVAYYFGATLERDAYFAAMVIPTYVSSVLIGSVGIMFLPIYVDIKTKKLDKAANYFLMNTITFSVLLSGIIVLSMILFSNNIIAQTAPGFEGNQLALTSNLLVVLSPSIGFQIITQLAGSVLQVKNRFLLPSLAPIFSTVITLFVVLALNDFLGIRSLAYGTLIGSAVSCFLLLLSLRNYVSFRFSLNLSNIGLIKLIKTSAPLLIAGVFYRLTGIFERGIGSSLPAGSISYLGYANQFMVILATFTSSGIATTIYPIMSKAWSENNFEQLKVLFIKGIRIILLMTLPISVVFLFWGIPIIQFLFERGAFTHTVTLAVSSVFSIMTIAFIATSLGGVIPKIFYFSGKTILISIINCLETLMYLLFAFLLSRTLGYKGLAIALSISTTFSVIVSFILLLAILKEISWYKIIGDFLIILFAAIIPSILLYGLISFLRIDVNASVFWIGIVIILYSLGYYYLLKILKISEIDLIRKKLNVFKYKLISNLKI